MELLVGIKSNPEANEKLKNAVIEGNLEKVQEAIKEGADPDAEFEIDIGDIIFRTDANATIQAARLGHVKIAKFLLKPDDVDSHTKLLQTMLFMRPFNLDFIEFLIKSGASIDRKHYGSSPIIYAIMLYNLNLIKLFCFYGANLNGNNDIGRYKTAIEFAHYWFNGSEDRIKSLSIKNFLENHFSRIRNLKNKNIKDIVHKVNTIIQKNLSDSGILLGDLRDLIENYLQYPENAEEFFSLPDSVIDEILKLYSEEFEKDEKTEKEKSEYEDPCIIM